MADAKFVFPLAEISDDVATAPLLCAGLRGWRSLKIAGAGKRIGLYGFGVAAHIIAQVAVRQGRDVFAFAKPGDTAAQAFAQSLGATWAGTSEEKPPDELDCAIIYAPVGALVPLALGAIRKGGRVLCACIHMSDIPAFPYRLLSEERELRSVANLTRKDGDQFFAIAAKVAVMTETVRYALDRANEALSDLRTGACKALRFWCLTLRKVSWPN